jgi:hypothetical protein
MQDAGNRPIRFIPIAGPEDAPLHHVLVPLDDDGVGPRRRKHSLVVFIVDRSGSMGRTLGDILLPACKRFLAEAKPDEAAAVFFNERAYTVNTLTASDFDRLVAPHAAAGGGTQIESGVEQAVTLALERVERAPSDADVLVHFVLFTDGDNMHGHQGQAFAGVMDVERQRLAAAFGRRRAGAYLSAVNIGRGADTFCAMHAHRALTTVAAAASTAVDALSCAARSSDIPAVVAKLSADFGALRGGSAVDIAVERHGDGPAPCGEGLVADPGARPAERVRAIVPTGSRYASCLFVGRPEAVASVNGRPFVVAAGREAAVEGAALLIEAVPDMVRQLRIAQVAATEGTDVGRGIAAVERVVAHLASHGPSIGEARTARARIKLMNRGINDLRHLLAEVKEGHGIANASSSQQASYIVGLDRNRHARSIIRRAHIDDSAETRVAEIVATLRARLGTPFEVDHDLPVSYVCQLGARELWNQAIDELDAVVSPADGGGKAVTEHDLLYGFGMLGYGLRVTRTDSAAVEPWNVRVDHVSLAGQRLSTTDAICALDAHHRLVDLAGQTVEDVVVLVDPSDPEPYERYLGSGLNRAYLGVVFARNPSVTVASQQTALVTRSLARAADQMAADGCTEFGARFALEAVCTLAERLAGSQFWQGVAAKLAEGDPRAHLTSCEEDGILNVLMPIAAVAAFGRSTPALAGDPARRRAVLHALVGQAVADAVAAEIKRASTADNDQEWSEQQALLDMAPRMAIARESVPRPAPDDEPEPEDIAFDDAFALGEDAIKHARGVAESAGGRGVPIRQLLRAWALVWAVNDHLIEAVPGTRDDPHIAARLRDPAVVQGLLPGLSARIGDALAACGSVRSALVAQGLIDDADAEFDLYAAACVTQAERCPRKPQRRAVSRGVSPLADISTPEARRSYLAATASDARRALYHEDLKAKVARNRARLAEAHRLLREREAARIEAEWFALHVGPPEVFTEEEIAAHNRDHPEDPWTASINRDGLATGLLNDRCCFRSCPLYLVGLGGTGDLWKHLAPGRCLPNFHGGCRRAASEADASKHRAIVTEAVQPSRLVRIATPEKMGRLDDDIARTVAAFRAKGM